MIKICNLCGGEVKMFHPRDIYGVRYKLRSEIDKPGISASYIYQCLNCKATVGCHNNTTKPLGTLANKEIRNARHLTHLLFDPIWKDKKNGITRNKLYELLSEHMGLSKEETHMGMFNIEQCRIAYKFLLIYKKKNNL